MATYTIDKITLPNGDICNLEDADAITDVQVNSTSVVSNNVANIPLASASSAGVVSTGAQTFIGDKTFAKSGSSGVTTLTIQGPISDSGIGAGVLKIKANYGDEPVTHTIQDNGDYCLQFSTHTTDYTLSGAHSGDYYIAYNSEQVTTSSSTVPVYFSDSEGALTACSGVVVTTGDQTFTGKKTFNCDDFTIGNGDDYPSLILEDTSNVANLGSVQFYNTGAQLEIQQHSGRNRTGVMETFSLPVTLSTDTQTNYNIITTKNIDDIPDASASVAGKVNTGAQTFAGIKTFQANAININGAIAYPGIQIFSQNSPGTTRMGGFRFNLGAVTPDRTAAYVEQASLSNGTPTGYFENYYFPRTTDGRTSSISYDILTTKEYMLNEIKRLSIPANGSLTITFSGDSRGFAVLSSYSAATKGLCVLCSSSTTASYKLIGEPTSISVSVSGTSLTFTSTYAYATMLEVFMFYGSVST